VIKLKAPSKKSNNGNPTTVHLENIPSDKIQGKEAEKPAAQDGKTPTNAFTESDDKSNMSEQKGERRIDSVEYQL